MQPSKTSRMVAGRSLGAWILALFVSAGAKEVNRTIDDQYGDVVTGLQVAYSPVDTWSQGNNCPYCAARPDNNSAFDGTWHDVTHVPDHDVMPLTMSLSFNGTAIYLYNILIKLVLTDVNITLDGKFASRFTLVPNLNEQYEYNASVFSQDNLPYGEHTVEMSVFGPNQVTVLFDYAIYTTNDTDDSTSASSSSLSPIPTGSTSGNDTITSSHKTNTGAIAGGVVGGVVVVALLLLAFLWFRRRPRKSHTVVPFEVDASNEDKSPDAALGAQGEFHVPSFPSDASRGDYSSSSPHESSQVSDESLRQNIQVLREQLEALRTERGVRATSTNPSQFSGSSSDLKASPLEREIQSLREEVDQLRSQTSSITSPTSPATTDLMREIAFLRAEMDEMRLQQEIIQGPLPSYSPPARPLPGVPTPDVAS